jgi:arylsulfatase A-like enzyme
MARRTETTHQQLRPSGNALLFVLCAALACGLQPSERVVRVPLVSFPGHAEDRVRVEGKPTASWFNVSGEQARIIRGRGDYALRFALEDRSGWRLRGAYGVVSKEPTSTRFRVVLEQPAQQRVLLEDTLESASGARPFELAVPRPGENAWLALEVEEQNGGSATSLWVEPVLERVAPRRPSTDSPNLLLVTSDTTRLDDLGVYGGPVPTQALSKLAADGVVLENAFAVAFGTGPSHASLFTGSQAREHGVYHNSSVLSEEQRTLAEILRDHGYTTAAFVGSSVLTRASGIDQGWDVFGDGFAFDAAGTLGRQSHYQRRADEVVSRGLAWLEEDAEEPFALWLHFYDPHQPYGPPGDQAAPFLAEGQQPPEWISLQASDGTPRMVKSVDGLSSEHAVELDGFLRAQYRGELAFVDAEVGRLLSALEQRGLYDRTLVVFTADHGEVFLDRSERLAFSHRSVIQEVSRVPLILKLPGSRLAGGRRDFLLGNLDIAPSLLEILGLAADRSWTGRSFVRELSQADARFRSELILEGSRRRELGVRTEEFGYREALPAHRQEGILERLGYPDGEHAELFELGSDPSEARNVLADREEVARRMSGTLAEFLSEHAAAVPEDAVSPEQQRALEALGYVE